MTGTERVNDVRRIAASELGPDWQRMLLGDREAMSANDRMLLFLDERTDASVSDIAAALSVSRSLVYKLVERLTSRGQVTAELEKELPEALGRPQALRIALTEAGKAAAQTVRDGGWQLPEAGARSIDAAAARYFTTYARRVERGERLTHREASLMRRMIDNA
jgi:predicted ArsR family transcriptional regulator